MMNKKAVIDDWFDFIFTVAMAILLFIFLNVFTSTTEHQELAKEKQLSLNVENNLLAFLNTPLSGNFNRLVLEQSQIHYTPSPNLGESTEAEINNRLTLGLERKKIVADLITDMTSAGSEDSADYLWPAFIWQARSLAWNGQDFLLIIEPLNGDNLKLAFPMKKYLDLDEPLQQLETKRIIASATILNKEKQPVKISLYYLKKFTG